MGKDRPCFKSIVEWHHVFATIRFGGLGSWRGNDHVCTRADLWQSGSTAPGRHQLQGARHRSGAAESRDRKPVSLGAISAGHRCRRHALDLGVIQQCAEAHPERRLGTPGHGRRLSGRKGNLGRQYAPDLRRHPRTALAPGGRVGDHDLRQLPRDRARCAGSSLCRRCEGWRSLVYPGRGAAFAAGAWVPTAASS